VVVVAVVIVNSRWLPGTGILWEFFYILPGSLLAPMPKQQVQQTGNLYLFDKGSNKYL